MKQKIISWCAEYLIFVGAIVVLFFLILQSTFQTGIYMFFTIALTITSLWFLGAILKFLIRKERPKEKLHNMIERDRYAFPSMHALTISSAFTYVLMFDYLYGVILFLIAFIIMFARVRTHMHYVVDMIAGFLLGVIYTFMFAPVFEKYISLFFSM